MKHTYKCPACGKRQNSVIEHQNATISFERNLKTGDTEETDTWYGEVESYYCPECGERLDYETIGKLL